METQKAQYEEFVKRQDREKDEQKQKADRVKAAYDQAREQHPHLVKNYDPPVKIRDPHLRRLAVNAQTERQKVTALERTQMEDKIRLLEKLDQQREKQGATHSRAAPDFARATSPERRQPENAAGRGQDSALSRAFAKAERRQEQTRQRTQV
jgi:hypothetical protein